MRKVELSLEIIRYGLKMSRNPCLVWSGGKDSTVMLYLTLKVCRKENLKIPIILACDPIPIPENREYCLRLAKMWDLDIILWEDILKDDDFNDINDVITCCRKLKVEPLKRFIRENYIDVLFVAIRHDEHPERAKEVFFSIRTNPPHVRVHPILHWTWLDVWLFIKQENIPINPLYLKGYTSLGCDPCTEPVVPNGFKSVDEIIEYVRTHRGEERKGRSIDKELVMEKLRRLGYF